MGRPRKKIDIEDFEKLCNIQCTKTEIQGWFEVSDKTLDKWIKETYGDDILFSDIYKQKSARGKIAIRRKQHQVGMGGNVTMLIWLGKNTLGQTDKQESTSIEKIQINIDKADSGL